MDEFEKWFENELNKENRSVFLRGDKPIYKTSWNAATETMQAKLDEKDKELEALRNALGELYRFVDTGISGRALFNYYVDSKLSDENGNPTKILKGE
jgi:hypothetical protein